MGGGAVRIPLQRFSGMRPSTLYVARLPVQHRKHVMDVGMIGVVTEGTFELDRSFREAPLADERGGLDDLFFRSLRQWSQRGGTDGPRDCRLYLLECKQRPRRVDTGRQRNLTSAKDFGRSGGAGDTTRQEDETKPHRQGTRRPIQRSPAA